MLFWCELNVLIDSEMFMERTIHKKDNNNNNINNVVWNACSQLQR
jgi:hypothetical protein